MPPSTPEIGERAPDPDGYGLATAESVVAFGLLTALAVFLAFFLDLFLTPALLALVYRARGMQ